MAGFRFRELYQRQVDPEPELIDGGVRPDPQQWRGEYVTVAEAAEWLRVNPMTVYRMIKRGDLHASRVGRQYRIHKSVIETLLNPKERS